MRRDNDTPWCDVCEEREATEVEDGVYRCDVCAEAHEAQLRRGRRRRAR